MSGHRTRGAGSELLIDGLEVVVTVYKGNPVSIPCRRTSYVEHHRTEPGVKGDTARKSASGPRFDWRHRFAVPLSSTKASGKGDTRTGAIWGAPRPLAVYCRRAQARAPSTMQAARCQSFATTQSLAPVSTSQCPERARARRVAVCNEHPRAVATRCGAVGWRASRIPRARFSAVSDDVPAKTPFGSAKRKSNTAGAGTRGTLPPLHVPGRGQRIEVKRGVSLRAQIPQHLGAVARVRRPVQRVPSSRMTSGDNREPSPEIFTSYHPETHHDACELWNSKCPEAPKRSGCNATCERGTGELETGRRDGRAGSPFPVLPRLACAALIFPWYQPSP